VDPPKDQNCDLSGRMDGDATRRRGLAHGGLAVPFAVPFESWHLAAGDSSVAKDAGRWQRCPQRRGISRIFRVGAKNIHTPRPNVGPRDWALARFAG
jgi:hypothetical protein